MSFTLTRPPSPSARESHGQNRTDVDHLSSALHAALSAFSPHPPTPLNPNSPPHSASLSAPHEHDMSREKEKSRLEIVLSSENLHLKGTGVDVEPALLSGHVALHLTESMSIKEINLSFRGKARLPAAASDALNVNTNPMTYIVCNHEWSFLEGEKRHSHTLKAGKHLFPFQLQIGGSLPSSLATTVFGGASVIYKLRATAVRPGLAHNLQAMVPVSILRSFAAEALEYQQSLEIENTWPDKLMYSIMIPHKAWAAGDKLTALVKFSPLTKGVRVLSVQTTVNETTKLMVRGGHQEHTRIIGHARHEIHGGKAVLVEEHHHRFRIPMLHGHHTPASHSVPSTPGTTTPLHTPALPHSNSTSYFNTANMMPLSHTSTSSSSDSGSRGHVNAEAGPSTSTAASTAPPSINGGGEAEVWEDEERNEDIVTHLMMPVPYMGTPSHALDPIIVSHRIRWSILIANADGHTSELRCSLPMHLLDYRLLGEAKAATAATRRLLIGGDEVPPAPHEETQLPSYPAHVRDRVANMFLPEGATMRVTNPWVHQQISPTAVQGAGGRSNQLSGASSPLEAHHVASHLPHAPASGTSTPLDWVNSELLLSLSQEEPPALRRQRESPHESTSDSNTSSGRASGRASRRQSRANSPERHPALLSGGVSPQVGGPNDTYVHGSGQANRNLHGIFQASMKPFTSLTHPSWLGSRTSSLTNLAGLTAAAAAERERVAQQQQEQQQQEQSPPALFRDPHSSEALLHRAFTEVPDYGVAARGFIGGVPPLSSMTGLPSYEEAERSASEPDLAARFARARAGALARTVPATPGL